jgi:hypothetical protein
MSQRHPFSTVSCFRRFVSRDKISHYFDRLICQRLYYDAEIAWMDDIFRSDFMRSFMQFQHHNITSDKLSDQNNERFYHEKQTVENRRPSKMGDVATLRTCNQLHQFGQRTGSYKGQNRPHLKFSSKCIHNMCFSEINTVS